MQGDQHDVDVDAPTDVLDDVHRQGNGTVLGFGLVHLPQLVSLDAQVDEVIEHKCRGNAEQYPVQ